MFIQEDKDTKPSALPDQQDETVFDVAGKPPAFLDRIQIKVKLEEIKVNHFIQLCMYIHTQYRSLEKFSVKTFSSVM